MSNKINIILTIIIICLIGYIIYDKYEDNKEPVNNTNVIDNRNTNNSDKDVKYYTYMKDIKSESENRVYKSVYLFDDKTYYYSYSDGLNSCNYWSKGKYTSSNNNITLKEEKHGGCDTCYYTNNLKTYTFKENNDTLISDKNEMLALSKVDILPVIEIEKLDGVKDCTKK